MTVLSLCYFSFLFVTVLAYWCVRTCRAQNFLLLAASIVFYGFWDWRSLWLIIGLSLIAYIAGNAARRRNRIGAAVGVLMCLTILFVFKYYDFFALSLLSFFPCLHPDSFMLKLALPIGVSFMVFKAISFIVDNYKMRISEAHSFPMTMLYISWFPQVAAGPIDRATNLMPQFKASRSFDLDVLSHGVAQIMYGLFKKMVVADTLCTYVDKVYAEPSYFGGAACVVAAVFYSLQIYCDFSGYSDIACGACRLFGIEPILNFDRPYLATDVSNFWRRWHMSLTLWFRDYVYIPLGGNRVPFLKSLRNVWVVFLLSGLWHGAGWTFVIWGGMHAFFLSVQIIYRKIKPASFRLSPILSWLLVFACVSFAWIFFRANSLREALDCIGVMATAWRPQDWSLNALNIGLGSFGLALRLLAVLLLSASYLMPRDCCFKRLWPKLVFSLACFVIVTFLSSPSSGEFIYFRF